MSDTATTWKGPDEFRPLLVSIDVIEADPLNVNRHPETNIRAIQTGLDTHGQYQPLVTVKRTDGRAVLRLVKGGGRFEAMKRLGWTQAAVIVVPDGDEKAIARAIADNQSFRTGGWNREKLAATLAKIAERDAKLASVGFENIKSESGDPQTLLDPGEDAAPANPEVNVVNLFLTAAEQSEYQSIVAELKTRYGLVMIADVVVKACEDHVVDLAKMIPEGEDGQ